MSSTTIHNVFKFAVVVLCSVGSISLGSATASPNKQLFNGRVVPDDPGTQADASVPGVDTDGNGIRDEIDRYIAQKYGAAEHTYRAAQAIAKASQRILLTNSRDIDASRAAVLDKSDTGACQGTQITNPSSPTAALAADLTERTFNVRSRLQQCKVVRNNVGFFSR